MRINVGSTNPVKVVAVEETICQYDMFKDAQIVPVGVKVEEFGHPKTLEDTIKGAIGRAKESFQNCDYSFGIESGLMPTPYTKSGYFETTVCAIYDGKDFHLGMSPSFEWPKKMTELILQGFDASQAFKEMGLNNHKKIGADVGAINTLTKGKINRKEYTKLSVMMALLHLENPGRY